MNIRIRYNYNVLYSLFVPLQDKTRVFTGIYDVFAASTTEIAQTPLVAQFLGRSLENTGFCSVSSA